MANIRIIVDGTILMDAAVSVRQGDLPSMDDLRASLQTASAGQFAPWQMPTIGALSAVLLEANVKGAVPDTTITVSTRGSGWTLDVEHAQGR